MINLASSYRLYDLQDCVFKTDLHYMNIYY